MFRSYRKILTENHRGIHHELGATELVNLQGSRWKDISTTFVGFAAS